MYVFGLNSRAIHQQESGRSVFWVFFISFSLRAAVSNGVLFINSMWLYVIDEEIDGARVLTEYYE